MSSNRAFPGKRSASRTRTAPLIRALAFLCLTRIANSVEDVEFSSLDPAAINQIVIMYRSGEALSDSAVSMMEEVEGVVKGSQVPGSDAMVFRKCDASKGENGSGMSSKGIETFPMIFVSIEGQGMGKALASLSSPLSKCYRYPVSSSFSLFTFAAGGKARV
jgi:hypothetical protein